MYGDTSYQWAKDAYGVQDSWRKSLRNKFNKVIITMVIRPLDDPK